MWRSSWGSGLRYGVFAYLTASADTTVTTGGTFVPILGTFANDPMVGFHYGETDIVYDGVPGYFEIDFHASVSSEDAGRTVSIGDAINGETLTTSSPSIMSVFCKYANEVLPLSGTNVVYLEAGDTIQLQLTSSSDGDVITVNHFTTTIRRFK